MDPKETDFDLVFIGGLNSAALLKFTQQHDDAQNLKMAILSADVSYVQPQCYFPATTSHVPDRNVLADSLSSMCDPWSLVGGNVLATKINPDAN